MKQHPRIDFRTWRLWADVFVWRHGWVWLLAMVLWVALGLVVLLHHRQELRITLYAQALQEHQETLRRTPTMPVSSDDAKHNHTVQAVLARAILTPLNLDDVIRSVYERAQDHGVAISQTEFRSTTRGHGGLLRQEMTMPIQGRYPQIKAFVIDVLMSYPGISLDQLVVRRSTAAQGEPDVRVHLSIWVDPGRADEAIRPVTERTAP